MRRLGKAVKDTVMFFLGCLLILSMPASLFAMIAVLDNLGAVVSWLIS